MSDKYYTYYPGVYTDAEKAVFDKANARMEAAKGKPFMKMCVDERDITTYARCWDGLNPLYMDKGYAEKSVWGGLTACPGAVDIQGAYPMLDDDADVLGDMFYYGIQNGEVELFAPLRPGDELESVIEEQSIEDYTPAQGSIFRKLRMSGAVSVKNARGETVARTATVALNGCKRIIDGSPTPSEFEQCFEWKTYKNALTPHTTTLEEWKYIEKLWAEEKIRGAQPLFWEDVSVGDEPAPSCSGPVTAVDMIRYHGAMLGEFPSTRQWLKMGAALIEDRYGMKMHFLARHYSDCHVPDSGALFYNTTARNLVLRTVTNWMGDAGFVAKYGWVFCNTAEAIYDPTNGAEELARVPYMRGKFVNRHGIEGDTVIGKGYVYNKYKNENGAYVELMCWGEDLCGDVLVAVPVTVKLPERQS